MKKQREHKNSQAELNCIIWPWPDPACSGLCWIWCSNAWWRHHPGSTCCHMSERSRGGSQRMATAGDKGVEIVWVKWDLAGERKHLPEWCKQRVGGGIPAPGCERSHWALGRSHSWQQTKDGGKEDGMAIWWVRTSEISWSAAVLLVLTSPSTPLAPTPKIIWRTLHVGPMINDVPVSTIAWQPPMQATGLPLMLILAGDTVQNDSETSICLIWMYFGGSPDITCPQGSASTAD